MTTQICSRCHDEPVWFGRLCVGCCEIESGARDPADAMPLVRGVRLDTIRSINAEFQEVAR